MTARPAPQPHGKSEIDRLGADQDKPRPGPHKACAAMAGRRAAHARRNTLTPAAGAPHVRASSTTWFLPNFFAHLGHVG